MDSAAALEDLLTFLRFPSVSTDPAHREDVRRCAEWVGNKLAAIGLNADVHPTAGHPIVVARNEHRPGKRTVLIYGHYDVQPVDPIALWDTPPFEPTIKDGVLFARGATDNKGQIMAHIQGVGQLLAEQGELPVNLIFLIEGEEEIGSGHLEEFLKKNREELACDVIAISDTGMIAPGVPTLTYGLRGIAALEVTVSGPAVDLHSGIYGGTVANPITALARLLATLHNPEGRVEIPGFYDSVEPLHSWEKEGWSKLPLDEARLLEITGSPELFGEEGYTPLERLWARPTAELNGIGGGYQGEGSKTVIPKQAFAKLTFRLVPNQQPETILAQARAHLLQHCPRGVNLHLEWGHSGEPYVMNPHSSFGQAAQRALRATFGKEVALIREGGSIPIVNTFHRVLGVETLLLGLALPDCRAHSPNENFPIANYEAGIRLNQEMLRELAGN